MSLLWVLFKLESSLYTRAHALHFGGLRKRLLCSMKHTMTADNSADCNQNVNYLLILFYSDFINLSVLDLTGQVPVLAAGRRSGTLLFGTGPSPSDILAGSSLPGPFPFHRLSCAEASWKHRQTKKQKMIFSSANQTRSLMLLQDNSWFGNSFHKR